MARISTTNGRSTTDVSRLTDAQVSEALTRIGTDTECPIRERLHCTHAVLDPTATDDREWLDAYADAYKTAHGVVWTMD